MSLKQLHNTCARMRTQNPNDKVTKETLERTIRKAWQERVDALFQSIPNEAVAFSQFQAWHVFDDQFPGVLEEFLISVASNGDIGRTMILSSSQFPSCKATDAEHIMRIMHALNEAWKESIRIIVQNNTDSVKISFFAI